MLHTVKTVAYLGMASLLLLMGCAPHSSLSNRVNASGKPSTSSGTVTDASVKQYYTKAKQNVVDITHYPPYHGDLVEYSFGDTTLPDRYDWWDTKTGQRFELPVGPAYVKLLSVMGPSDIEFLAVGKNATTDRISFPYVIRIWQSDEKSPFSATEEPYFFRVSHVSSFGDHKAGRLVNIHTTADGVDLLFGPNPGHEGEFMAGATGIPDTTTAYTPATRTFTIRFRDTPTILPIGPLPNMTNAFIQSAVVHQAGTDTVVSLTLTKTASYYIAEDKEVWDETLDPYVHFTFAQNPVGESE